MTVEPSLWLLLPLALVALLYACVGHAGATGYIAVLALAGLPAAQIKPLALLLASDAGSYMTGTTILVDGGVLANVL